MKLKDFACPNADGAKLKSATSTRDKKMDTIFFCFIDGSFLNLLGYSMPRYWKVVKQNPLVQGTLLTKWK